MMRKLTKSLVALILAGAAVGAGGCSKGSTEAPAAAAPAAPVAAAAPAGSPRKLAIQVTEAGYEPSPLTLRKGEPVELTLTRTTDATCATEIVLEEHNINAKLPLNQPVTVAFTPRSTGELRYGCAMGKMISGVLKVE